MGTTKESRTAGIILIILGTAFLILNAADIHWRHFWPLVIILGGIGFIALFLHDRKNFGVLMPASIFFIIGALFTVCSWYGWELMSTLWPFFIAAPGIGFFAMYTFGPHENGLLIPAFFLTGFAFILLLAEYDKGEYWPVLLILIGLTMILRHRT